MNSEQRTSRVVEQEVLIELDQDRLLWSLLHRTDVLVLQVRFRKKDLAGWLLWEAFVIPVLMGMVIGSLLLLPWMAAVALLSWPFMPTAYWLMLLGYLAVLYWTLTPFQLCHEFRHRHKLVGMREFTLDFARAEARAVETFDHVPSRNRTIVADLSNAKILQRILPSSEDAERFISADVQLFIQPRKPMSMEWANRVLTWPVFSVAYDDRLPEDTRTALERVAEIRNLLEICFATRRAGTTNP